jgi:outer membrane protein assembly factor BamB
MKINLSREVIEQGINLYPFDYPMKTSNTNMEIYNAYEYDYKHEEVIKSDQEIYNPGELIWKYDSDFENITEPVIHEGRVFMISDKNTLHSISLLNGDELWSKKINGLFEVPPIVYKDNLYVITNIGQLLKINPINGYIESETWIGSSNNVTEVDIGLYQNNLLIANFDKEMDIYNIKTDNISFSLDLEYRIPVNPLVDEGLIYIIDYGGYLTVCDIDNEQVKYRRLIGGSDFQPCISKKYIFINTNDGEFLQLNKANGEIINNFSDGYNIHKSPIIRDDMVLIRTGYGIYGFLVDDISKPLLMYKSQNPQTDFGLLDNDSLWIRNDKGIAFIDIQSAEVIWEQDKANIDGIWNPGLNQSLIIQTEDDNVYSLDYVHKKIKWSIPGLEVNIQYEPIIYDKRILLCGEDVKSYYIGD